MNDLADVRK
jgi:hypothetical protein